MEEEKIVHQQISQVMRLILLRGICCQNDKAQLFSPPTIDKEFNISDPSSWSDLIDDNTKCVTIRHRPI
jgi:hypothetical protein